MEIFRPDAGVLYKYLLAELISGGETVKVKDRWTRELMGVHLILPDPLKNIILTPSRNVNLRFAVAEWLWIMKGRNDLEYLQRFVRHMVKYSDDGVTLNGAYGPKIVNQLGYVIETLTLDSSSRQAVLTIWERNPKPSRDIPCTISMQFLVRGGALNLLVNMRSSDAWLGIPYDIFTFTMIQNYVAAALDVELGQFHMFLGSSHLYVDDYEVAKEVTAEFSSHGRSHDMKDTGLLDPENLVNPLAFWEAMLISKDETRRRISSYDIARSE